ncbi:CoA transferase [Nonomuraea sp. NPDC049624]|uniref:CoA transferase n=3 Tax=unclassified Nonomuraea TaxID=2593643 RepID=UPI00341A3561
MDVTPGSRAAGRSVAEREAVAWPLAGVVVRARGESVALRVAVQRLCALGCEVRFDGAPPPGGSPAGWLGVASTPFGRPGEALPECGIGWSGPVGVPMAGEHDVQAACGIAHVHGRAAGGPRALRLDYASVCAGVLTAQALTAVLLALLRGGPALAARTSVAQAALLALTQYIAVATCERFDPPLSAGRVPAPGEGRVPPFRSADGVRFEIETFDAECWRRFWELLGAEPMAVAAGWPPFQQRFATATCALPAGLGRTAAAACYRDVVAAAADAGVSVLPVRDADAPLAPPPASPWRLRALTETATGAAAGAATKAAAGEPAGLPPLARDARGPLAGLLVVESTNRVQGPLAGHVLGLLGADVVRLEPPGGDPLRGVPPMAGPTSARFLALNRGKRALEADLKSAAGRRAALRLIACAHVFLHNWPPGRACSYGLDHDDLAPVRPSLVYAQAGGWAEALPPPQPMGTDYLVQAYSGVAARLAGPGEQPTPSLMTLTDVLGALISAEAVVAALVARARTGAGVRAGTALIDAARLLRATPLPTSPPTPPAIPPGSPPATSSGAPPASRAAAAVTDLAAMADDPAFDQVLDRTPQAAYSRAPWTFVPAPHHEEAL